MCDVVLCCAAGVLLLGTLNLNHISLFDVLPTLTQVVATIHQPNSLITDTFDDWALLAQGRLLFSGPWSTAVPYFEAAGYPCPLYR
jgi:hypothetical protein